VNVSLRLKRSSALSFVDVLVVLAVLGILAALLLPRFLIEKRKAQRIHCVDNLKQIGQAFTLWSSNHGEKYPIQLSITNGGTMEYTSGPNAFRHFQMSNELSMSSLFYFCPAESDSRRKAATNINTLSNSNISYFVGLDASRSNLKSILAGDRNITNATSPRNGILEVTTNNPSGWTKEMHHEIGNIVLVNGSVWQLNISRLQETIANTSLATNHLQMPILVP
jgi:type II secretory pathway pseudopilin PulG